MANRNNVKSVSDSKQVEYITLDPETGLVDQASLDALSNSGVGSGGGGATNLTVTTNATTVTVVSSSGTDATIASASTSQAGILTGADKTKLDGIATGATVNSTDAFLRDRANHTGTQAQSTITTLVSDLAAKAPLASPTFTGTVSGVTAAMVGLGNVNNTTDAAKPVSTAQQTALDLKANLASPALTGTPTAPTATAGTSTTQVATTAFVTTADNLKAPLASPAFTGTPTVPTATTGTNTTQAASTAFVQTEITANQVVVGVPSAFTSRTLTNADNGDNLICGSSQTATVNTGLVSGFGCSFKGTIAFAGTATVNDIRTTGAANPWCALVQIAANTYDVVGGKA